MSVNAFYNFVEASFLLNLLTFKSIKFIPLK